MRASFLAQALCGAASVSAVAVPNKVIEARSDASHVPLSAFSTHTFPLLNPNVALAQAGENNTANPPVALPLQSSGASPKIALATPSTKATAASTCTNPSIHYEWRDMSSAHKAAYIKAEVCLHNAPSKLKKNGAKSRYEDLAYVHQQLSATIHNVGIFLPWHRYYMHAHETLLRNECGYTGPMPWWDETKDAGKFHSAPVFTEAYFGHGVLKSGNSGTCITSGAFKNTNLYIGPGQAANNKHCLSRAVDESLSAVITTSFVNSCNSHDNFTDMWKCSFTGYVLFPHFHFP